MPFHSFPTINLILLFVATVSVVDASPDSFTPGAIIVTGNIKGAGRSSTIYQARLAITASCVYAAAYTAQRVVMLKHVDALSLTDAWTDEYTKLSPDKGGANGIDIRCWKYRCGEYDPAQRIVIDEKECVPGLMAIVDESIRKYTGALGGTYFEGGVYYGADYAYEVLTGNQADSKDWILDVQIKDRVFNLARDEVWKLA